MFDFGIVRFWDCRACYIKRNPNIPKSKNQQLLLKRYPNIHIAAQLPGLIAVHQAKLQRAQKNYIQRLMHNQKVYQGFEKTYWC